MAFHLPRRSSFRLFLLNSFKFLFLLASNLISLLSSCLIFASFTILAFLNANNLQKKPRMNLSWCFNFVSTINTDRKFHVVQVQSMILVVKIVTRKIRKYSFFDFFSSFALPAVMTISPFDSWSLDIWKTFKRGIWVYKAYDLENKHSLSSWNV